MSEAPTEPQIFLATLPPNAAQRRMALAIVLILLLAFAALIPFRATPLPPAPAFISVFQTALFLNDFITAVLLLAQYSILRWRALLILAAGYLFTALISVPFGLSFLMAFSPSGTINAGNQTAGWLFIAWHIGLPLAVIAYALLKEADQSARPTRGSPPMAVGTTAAIVLALVCGTTWAASTLGNTVLPWLFVDGIRISSFGRYVAAAATLLSAFALAILWSRRRSVLDLWLIVVLCAWTLEIAFFVLFTDPRFSLAWSRRRRMRRASAGANA